MLGGSVQRAGGRVRITGPLIDATSGSHVLDERFEGDLPDIFDLQDGILSVALVAEAGGMDAEELAAIPDETGDSKPEIAELGELLDKLDSFIGLQEVKATVRRMADLIHVQNLRREAGLQTSDFSHHLVLTDNPGTGKTTVARLLAQIYGSLGVLTKGHLIETDRSQLVAAYVGQTANKTRDRVMEAMGGALFVDEAYSLVRGQENDFGREAIDTLVKLMEDHRVDLVVIVAGYPQPMGEFLEANPGLASRFAQMIEFSDYSDEDLLRIFDLMADDAGYVLAPGTRETVQAWISRQPRNEAFGNARMVRNLLEDSIAAQAERIVRTGTVDRESLQTLMPADVIAAEDST